MQKPDKNKAMKPAKTKPRPTGIYHTVEMPKGNADEQRQSAREKSKNQESPAD